MDRSPPLAVFAKSQPDPSSNLPVPSCALPSHPAQRHPQILWPTAEFSKTTYIRIQLPIRLSVLSQQPVAGLSCVVYQACPRSRPTVQATARLQKPAPPRNPGSTPLSDKALDEDDTALEAASSVPPSLQRPVSPARPCPPSLWHTGTQESLVPGPDAWSPAAGSGKISGIRFSFAQSDLIYPWKPLPTHTHTYTTPPPGSRTRPFSYTIICTPLDLPADEKSQSSQPLSNFLPWI